MWYWSLKVDNNTKRFLIETVMWIGIYFGIAFLVSRLLTFPYSLIVIVFAVIGLGVYRRRRHFRKAGQAASFGSSYFGKMFGSQRGINYYCLNCGTKHDQSSCPNCGSKLKKAEFWLKGSVSSTEHLKVLEKRCIYVKSYYQRLYRENSRISKPIDKCERFEKVEDYEIGFILL